MSNNSTNVIANDTYSSPEKIDSVLKRILQNYARDRNYIKRLTFENIKPLIVNSLSFKEDAKPQGFENPVKSIAKLKYIILKRQFGEKEEGFLLIRLRELQNLEKIFPAILDKEVRRLHKKYTVDVRIARIQRKTKKAAKKAEKKAAEKAAKAAAKAASRAASGKSYSKFFKGSDSNSNSSNNSPIKSPIKSPASWSPNYQSNTSPSRNENEVIINRNGMHTKKNKRNRNNISYNSD
jgi:hypothetical protein